MAVHANFQYYVELRNKAGTLLEILQRDIFDIVWTYETIGGCAEATISLRREFDNFGDIDLDYDVRIYRISSALLKPGDPLTATLPMEPGYDGGALELRWRGFIRTIVPVLDRSESVRLLCAGYFRQLEYIAVPALTRSSEDVGAAARYIIDTYVTAASQIKRSAGLNFVRDQGITISSTGLTFDTNAYEALRTLADIGGNVEWGVRPGLNPAAPEDNEIYFVARSNTVKQTWIVGDLIKYFESPKTTDDIVRKVYLRGAGAFTATVTSGLGLESGRYKERIILVAAIANASDATLWGTAFFSRYESAQERGRASFGATDAWIENRGYEYMPPIGKLRIQGGTLFISVGATLPFTLPQTMNQLTIGGTTYKEFRCVRVSYRPSGNALQVDVELGERGSALEDYLRGIEYKLSELRQA